MEEELEGGQEATATVWEAVGSALVWQWRR